MNSYDFKTCRHFALKCIFHQSCVLIDKEKSFPRCSEIIQFIGLCNRNGFNLKSFKKEVFCIRREQKISLYSCLQNQFYGYAKCQNCQQASKDILFKLNLEKLLNQVAKERVEIDKKIKFKITQRPDPDTLDSNTVVSEND